MFIGVFSAREVATLFCRLRKPDARLLFCCAVIELPWFSCFVLFCFAFVLGVRIDRCLFSAVAIESGSTSFFCVRHVKNPRRASFQQRILSVSRNCVAMRCVDTDTIIGDVCVSSEPFWFPKEKRKERTKEQEQPRERNDGLVAVASCKASFD